MATRTIYLRGKGKYVRVRQPDTSFNDPSWRTGLYLTPESLNDFKALQEEGLLNEIKTDEEGDYVQLRRKTEIEVQGKKIPLAPPVILDGSKKLEDGSYPLLDENIQIGNGSDLTCKVSAYQYKKKFGGGKGLAIRLESILVHNLVPYVPSVDFTKDQMKQIKGLSDQPAF